MRALLALITACAVACGAPVVESRPPCVTDADCADGTICGKGSARKNSAKPDAPLVAERPAECFPPCTTELTDNCALPACPTSGNEVYASARWKEGGNRPEGWHEASGEIRVTCGDFSTSLVLTCDFRSGVLSLSGGVETTRPWQDGFGNKAGCDYLRERLASDWWPWSF